MKATLEFTLPEEASEHEDAVNGSRWKALVFEYDQLLRSWLKYREAGDKAPGLQAARGRKPRRGTMKSWCAIRPGR